MGHVFISYARQDRDFVGRLAAEIRSRGIPVWEDSHIEHGEAWYRTIERHLDESSVVVLVMTEASRESTWVSNELLRAQRRGIPVRPLLVDGDPWLAIESVNFIDLRDGAEPDESFYEDLARTTSAGPPAEGSTASGGGSGGALEPVVGAGAARLDTGGAAPVPDSSPGAPGGRVPVSRRVLAVTAAVVVGLALVALVASTLGRTEDPELAATDAGSPSDAATTPDATTDDASDATAEASTTAADANVVGADVFRVNFQRRGVEQPDGYLVDFGQPFGEQESGLEYGWVEPGTSTPLDMTAHARDRDLVEDQLRDTLMHFRNFNPATEQWDVGSWEFAVEDGTWLVRVVVGEPRLADNLHNLTVEGVPAITDFVSSEAGQAQEDNTVMVEVEDGRLTMDTVPRGATKIVFTEFERLS